MNRIVILTVVMLALAVPAFGEHETLDCDNDAPHDVVAAAPDSDRPAAAPESARAASARQSRDLDIHLKVGRDRFNLGGRLFGPNGVAGAWLNGQLRADGFSMDGRVQSEGGRAYTFKLNADVADWVPLTAWRWLLGWPGADY